MTNFEFIANKSKSKSVNKFYLKYRAWLQDTNLGLKKFHSFLVLAITFISIILFLLLRDQRLIHNLTKFPESKNAVVNSQELICNDLPPCFRFSHRLALTLLDNFYTNLILIADIPPDKSISGGITLEDRQQFIQNMSLITIRILVFVLLFLTLKNLLNTSFNLTLIVLSLILIANSGILYLLSTAYLNLGVEQYSWLWLRNLSSMYLLDYDWIALLIILLILKMGNNFWIVFMRNKTLSFVSGFVLTSFFEYLGIFCAIYIVLCSKFKLDNKLLIRLVFLFFGSVVYISGYSVLAYEPTNPTVFNTFSSYFNENLDRILILPLLVSVFMFFPILLMLSMAKVLTMFFNTKNIKLGVQNTHNLFSAIMSFIIIVLVGFFTSGLTTEFGRQTFALQILLSIYIWMRVLSNFKFAKPKESVKLHNNT